jgi:hypothetical protein
MNEAKSKTNIMEEKNPKLQTQESVVPQEEIEITKLQLEKLMNQTKKWKGHNKNALC